MLIATLESNDTATQTDKKSKKNKKRGGIQITIESPRGSLLSEEEERNNVPSVRPPKSNKSALYTNPKVFSDTDKRAVQVRSG